MKTLAGLLLGASLALGSCVSGLALVPPPAAAACAGPLALDPRGLPVTTVAGYGPEQLGNAAAVVTAGGALGVPVRGQIIAVMTAMGESGLRVLDRGDAVGPDSRGLFQQRDNGAWGGYTDRMDPVISSTNFYNALIQVEGWETLPPTIAAHRVQRNADPFHYERFWAPAVQVVTALTGAPASDLECSDPPPGDISTDGWVRPAAGRLSSPFGYRVHPITGVRKLHSGMDIAGPCGAPIYAAGPGLVVRAGPAPSYGTLVVVDHGGGVLTRYAHMYDRDVLVAVGTTVSGGTAIGRIGSNGMSTGCHLHLEVQQEGNFIDPAPFLSARGVVL